MPKQREKTTKTKRYVITERNWKPSHTQMLIMVQKNTDEDKILAKFAISKSQFDRIRCSPYFQERLKALETKVLDKFADKEADRSVHDKVRDRLFKASDKAARLLTKALKDPKALNNIQLKVCQDILDRTGHKPKEVIETHERVFAPEEIQSAMETVKELEYTVERLTNAGNPFVLSHEARKGISSSGSRIPDMSSATDEGSLDVPEIPIEEADSPGPETSPA